VAVVREVVELSEVGLEVQAVVKSDQASGLLRGFQVAVVPLEEAVTKEGEGWIQDTAPTRHLERERARG
jgi:hypothetical protein